MSTRHIRRPARFRDSAPDEEVEAEIDDQWPVEKLLDRRTRLVSVDKRVGRKLKPRVVKEFLVSWKGDWEPTWEAEEDISSALKREWRQKSGEQEPGEQEPGEQEPGPSSPRPAPEAPPSPDPLDLDNTPNLRHHLEALHAAIRTQLNCRTTSSEGFSGRAACYIPFPATEFLVAFFRPYVQRRDASSGAAQFDFDENSFYELSLSFEDMHWVLGHIRASHGGIAERSTPPPRA